MLEEIIEEKAFNTIFTFIVVILALEKLKSFTPFVYLFSQGLTLLNIFFRFEPFFICKDDNTFLHLPFFDIGFECQRSNL